MADIATLRERLLASTRDDAWKAEVCSLLEDACRLPEFADVWLPYLEAHQHLFSEPLQICQSFAALEQWTTKFPFAPVALFISLENQKESRYKDILGSPLLRQVRSLTLRTGDIGLEGCQALASNHDFGVLYDLELPYGRIPGRGCEVLASVPQFATLRTLNLSGNQIDDKGCIALANSPHLSGLEELYLQRNQIGNEGCIALANSPYLRNLRVLWLEYNQIRHAGRMALQESRCLESLVDVDGCSKSYILWG